MLNKTSYNVAHQLRNTPLMKADLADSIVAQLDLSSLDELDAITPELQASALDSAMIIASDAGLSQQLFNQLNTRASAFAKARAAEMVTQITDSTMNDLRVIISSGLDSKLSRDQIADLIQSQDSDVFSPARADLIAATEIRIANGQGALNSMKEAQALGINIMKEWLPDDDPCPTCQANADQGPIPIDDDFDSGDDASPAHPHCECTIISRITKGE